MKLCSLFSKTLGVSNVLLNRHIFSHRCICAYIGVNPSSGLNRKTAGVWKVPRYSICIRRISFQRITYKRKHPLKKFSANRLSIPDINDANNYTFVSSSLLEIDPIWAFATQPLVLFMPRNKGPHPEGLKRPEVRFYIKSKACRGMGLASLGVRVVFSNPSGMFSMVG